MHNKVHVDATRLVDNKGTIAGAVVRHSILGAYVLEGQDISNGAVMGSYISVVLDMGLEVGGQVATVTMDCHRVRSLPNTRD